MCVVEIEVTEVTRFVPSNFVTLLESFWKFTEESRMMVTIQIRRIIKAYLRRSTNTVKKYYPAFIKFPLAKFIKFRRCDQNLSVV